MNAFDMELSWLVYKATRDTWMDDAEHLRWKQIAWAEAKEKARQDPALYGRLPEALITAMKAQHQSTEGKHHELQKI